MRDGQPSARSAAERAKQVVLALPAVATRRSRAKADMACGNIVADDPGRRRTEPPRWPHVRVSSSGKPAGGSPAAPTRGPIPKLAPDSGPLGSYIHMVTNRSCQSGLDRSINSIFQSRSQRFSDFSRWIASSMLLKSWNHTSFVTPCSFFGEGAALAVATLEHAPAEIVGHADVKRAARIARENVDGVDAFLSHRRRAPAGKNSAGFTMGLLRRHVLDGPSEPA